MQKNKSKEIYNKVARGRLNKFIAIKQLKVLNLNADDIKLIIELAIIKYS